ncbi:MAG: ATP-binding protein [Cyanobacteria bacterium J06632_3]
MTATSSQSITVEPLPIALPRTLTLIETLGFGLTGLLLWLSVAPGANAELGTQAMWVWVPGAVLGVIVNLQVRQLGQQFPDVAGGTPNYLTRLLPGVPWLTRYAALGYFLSWMAVLPVNAIILTELIQVNLSPLGIVLPEMGLKVSFVLLAFIVAFSGSRALSTLHLVFLLPAVGLLLFFCIQGSVWLVASDHPQSLTAVSFTDTSFSLQGWAKWYLNGTYAFYACETASGFVADSKQPQKTLQSLIFVAALIPIVYVMGSWLLLHLPISEADPQDPFLTLLAAAKPYWGTATPLLVTFLIVSGCLLSFATSVSIGPRVLYQLAKDRQLSPLFAHVSEEGVFGAGLGLTLFFSLSCLVWNDLHQIVMVTGVGWLISFIVLHVGLWYQRKHTGGFLAWMALAMAILEIVVLVVGGWAWGFVNLSIGLSLPLVIILCDRLFYSLFPQLPVWLNRLKFTTGEQGDFENLIAWQVMLLVGFTSLVVTISWRSSAAITGAGIGSSVDFLAVVILVMSYLGVAIAGWTVFPQIAAIHNARQSAESLSEELGVALKQVQKAQLQVVQQEKLSSLGQLVAGIAHEINNPVSFVHGNLTHVQTYASDLLALVQLYQNSYPKPTDQIATEIEEIDLEFLSADLPKMLSSMRIGTDRIREIVLSLRNFSRKDEATCKSVDVHAGIDSTLLILQHRLKPTSVRPAIEVLRDYGKLPLVECYTSQLNQVFLNILANAIDALEESNMGRTYKEIEARPNQITIRTQAVDEAWIEIMIADNGPGIPENVRDRIFDPFFTTKPAGKGTGLGMSISYQIVTQYHQGKLYCISQPDQGTEFTIQIPKVVT